MKNLISKVDYSIALFLKKHVNRPWLNKTLSKLNRGEILVVVLILSFYFFLPQGIPMWFVITYIALFAYLTDRFVLLLKKKISRARPLVSVIGKIDSNPDMKHSFPSAHSANSMVVLSLLVFGFNFPWPLLFFSILAGLGRLFSLHHFVSDILGGWIIGLTFSIVGLLLIPVLLPLLLSH